LECGLAACEEITVNGELSHYPAFAFIV
jgi:hypothetical protein